MGDIIWFSREAKAAYELKPEDYDFCTGIGYPFVVRLFHKSGQYVGYVAPLKGGVVPNTEPSL